MWSEIGNEMKILQTDRKRNGNPEKARELERGGKKMALREKSATN